MSVWSTPRQHPPLESHEIHVWKVALDQPAACVESLFRLLAPDELARAHRFKSPTHRDAFVVTRGVLRDLLARYMAATPQSLKFSTAAHGKPFLTQPETPRPIRFNVSHSHQLALLAFASAREVGIDVESIHHPRGTAQLVERVCSPEERAAITSHAAHLQHQVFLQCWTRKEAFVKATGQGLTTSLQDITVSLRKNEPAALLCVEGDDTAPRRWRMEALAPHPDYVAALVVEGHDWTIRPWNLAEPGQTDSGTASSHTRGT